MKLIAVNQYVETVITAVMDTTMTNQLIIDAFKIAVASRRLEPGLLLYSDRGVQYRSGEYQHLLSRPGVKLSMSRKGNCWESLSHEVLWV